MFTFITTTSYVCMCSPHANKLQVGFPILFLPCSDMHLLHENIVCDI